MEMAEDLSEEAAGNLGFQSVREIMGLLHLDTAGCLAWLLGLALGAALALALVHLAWGHYWARQRDGSCPLPLPPGSMGLPFLGETLTYFTMGTRFFLWKMRTLGPVYRTHLLGRPMVRVIGAANIREVVLFEHSRVAMHSPASAQLILGPRSLACSTGNSHRRLKKQVLQAFSDLALEKLLPDMRKIIRHHLSLWAQQGDVIAYHACARLTFHVAAELLVGLRLPPDELEELWRVFQVLLDNVFCLPVDLPGFAFRQVKKARCAVAEKIRATLEADEGERDPPSILGNFRRGKGDSEPVEVEEVTDMACEFLFAGNSTTSSTATSLLLCLGRDPEVKAALEEEVTHLTSDPDYETLRSLPCLDHVLKEVLRLMVPVGAGFRQALCTLQIGIPKGWTVLYSIRETIQTSEFFPKGDEFQPERWKHMDLHGDVNKSLSYKPFGAGARACVGERFARLFMKVFMLELVRDYRWKLKNSNPVIQHVPVTRPEDFLPMHFSRKA